MKYFSFFSRSFRYTIGEDGMNASFTDLRSGREYCTGGHFASLKAYGREHISNRITSTTVGVIKVAFQGISATVEISAAEFDEYVAFEVVGFDPDGWKIDELKFCIVKLGVEYGDGSDFVPTMLAMNLRTNVDALPGFSNDLGAICCDRFGFKGAKAAIAAGPEAHIRDYMKEIALAASISGEIPHSDSGGPWAADSAKNRGSYCFNFHGISLDDLDEWIAMAKKFGIRQLDFHGGQSFRFGDLEPDPKRYPEGRKTMREVIRRIHDAGMLAGLHTYAFFMSKQAEWVTPVPHPELGWFKKFTLAQPLDADSDVVTVNESTAEMTTVTGFFQFNSTTLRIGTELITYTGIEKSPPFRFTGVKRGAHGTAVSAHAAGEEAFQLKECFGLFTPGADTRLFVDVAARTAEMYNECDFDMMYFDALDGEAILAGQEYAWHYGSKFIFEIVKRIRKPAIIEYSTHHHHLWFTRSRMGAWDTPTRSYKRFIDFHCENNRKVCDRQYLPGHLGWWTVNPQLTIREHDRATQYERMFEDDVEYLCCKCAANGYSLSVMGIEKRRIENNKGAETYAATMRMYEDLREKQYFSDEVKAMLAVPGRDFKLRPKENGKYLLSPAEYAVHKVDTTTPRSNTFIMSNKYGAQKPFIRIEALMTAEPYEAAGAITLSGQGSPDGAAEAVSAAQGCTLTAAEADGELKFTAVNKSVEAGWACLKRTFAAPLDLGAAQAIGVWIYGDGKGETINVQLRSPKHLVAGFSDHMIRVDFTGWKYFQLVENDGGKLSDVKWPYDDEYYGIYREGTHYDAIESVSVWCAGIPGNETVKLRFRPIKALPVSKNFITDPTLNTMKFHVKMESGTYLEYTPENGECKHFDSLGGLISEVAVTGKPPVLTSGTNKVKLELAEAGPLPQRCKLTLRTEGEPLEI